MSEKKPLLPPWVSQRSRELAPGVGALASPAMSVNRGFSGPPDAKLACVLFLALELLYPADVLRAFLWITVQKLFST